MATTSEAVLPKIAPAPVKERAAAPAPSPTQPGAPEYVLPKEFPDAAQLTAFHSRLGRNHDALDPQKKDLPELKSEDLNNLDTSITVAENASTAERVDLWEKIWQKAVEQDATLKDLDEEQKAQRQLQMWIADIVEKYGRGDPNFKAILTAKNIGGINLSNFSGETAKQIYDRYFQDTGETPDVEVVIVRDGEKQTVTVSSNINKFVEDIFAAYNNNHAQIETDIEALKWYAGVFGSITLEEKEGTIPKQVHANEIVKEIILTKIKLAEEQKRQQLLAQSNFQAEIDNQPTRRENWKNQTEKAYLTYMNVHGRERTKREKVPRPVEKTEISESRGKEEASEKVSPPWDRVPRPAQPIRLREGSVEKDEKGNIKGERAQRNLIWGTPEHPLVVEAIWANGSKEFIRQEDPERSYHIPVKVYFDNDVTEEQKLSIRQALPNIFAESGVPPDFVLESSQSASDFFNKTVHEKGHPDEYSGGTVINVAMVNSEQEKGPHHVVIITNRQLHRGAGWILGAAYPDTGAIISIGSLWNRIKNNTLRNDTVATELGHEIGHVYGLPSLRRGADKLNAQLGNHCKNRGCSMQQAMAVPDDSIRKTNERHAHLQGHFYCQECHEDLAAKFKTAAQQEKSEIPAGTHAG